MTRTLSPCRDVVVASSTKNALASSMFLNIFQFPATIFMLFSFRHGTPDVRPLLLFILGWTRWSRWQSLCTHSRDSLPDDVHYCENDAGTLDLVPDTRKASDFRQHQPCDGIVVFTR